MAIKTLYDNILNSRDIYSGKKWISHGNNVVTIKSGVSAFQSSSNYVVNATIVQIDIPDITNRITGATKDLPVFISNNDGNVFK